MNSHRISVAFAVAVTLAGFMQGCGASAIGTHARIAQGLGMSLQGAMDVFVVFVNGLSLLRSTGSIPDNHDTVGFDVPTKLLQDA